MHLTPSQNKLYQALLLGEQRTSTLMEILEASGNVVKVQICKMRKQGLEIRCNWGKGYWLEKQENRSENSN